MAFNEFVEGLLSLKSDDPDTQRDILLDVLHDSIGVSVLLAEMLEELTGMPANLWLTNATVIVQGDGE